MSRFVFGLLTTLIVIVAAQAAAPVQDEPPAVKIEQALMRFLGSPAVDADGFLADWIDPMTINEYGREACVNELVTIHARLKGMEPMDIMIDGEGMLVLEFGAPGHDPQRLFCEIQEASPPRISNLWIENDRDAVAVAPIEWDTLIDRLNEEEQNGFAGAVLVVRDGEVVLHQGYGLANREMNIKNTADTVFAIGSAPIDFTYIGILMLQEQGKLELSDPVTKYFSDVPPDKQRMTIEHLMSGSSGLQNFHGAPTDRDHDHSWISRDEAMRRIFAQELLFEPGAGREHSHSAWGVLAAILEIVSGQSYQDFTRDNLFEPLGMNDTGFHGDPVPEKRIAIGYGFESDGSTNAPPYWGTASWLVLGSGGQVSTVGDMSRWITATLEGRLINEANTKRFLREVAGQVLNGGNAYGFEIYYTYSPGNSVILLANAVDASSRRAVQALADSLGELVLDASAPPFSLGIGMKIDDDRVTISEVRPGGGAAEPGGLLEGDIIDGIDGQPLGDDPLGIINPYLETGKAIPFDIERDGKSIRIVITPKRRE